VSNRGRRRAWSSGRNLKMPALAVTAVLLIAACHRSREPASPVITIEHEITPQPIRVVQL